MISALTQLYKSGQLDKNQCEFPETLIFNEGWLLRSILTKWKLHTGESKFPFLPFPKDVRIYSESQLRTPFKRKPKNETNTHVDGIVGDFCIREGTKSGITVKKNFKYLTVFEAKMYSGLAKGTKNIPEGYNQVSRTML